MPARSLMARICNGDATAPNIPQTYSDLSGTVPPASAPTALVSSPPLSDNSASIATTAWVKGQNYGSGGGVAVLFADQEVPSGVMNALNTVFTLLAAPNPPISLQIFYNSSLLDPTQYSLTTNTITLGFAPDLGDSLVTFYRH